MPWFENEDFWRTMYPYMFPAERFSAEGEQVTQIVELTKFNGRAVLDLCCGPGRHAVEFARRGFTVTGVDRSSFLLDCARHRALEVGVSIEWIMEDMRRFKRPAAFDLACSIFTSFGYFEDEEENLRVLRNVHENLKDAGLFVIDVIGKERLSRVWQNTLSTEYADGALLVQRPQVRSDWTRIHNEWILLKDGCAQSFHFEHTIYSGRELKDRLLASGFLEVQLFGDLGGAPYGVEASRLVAVARKA
jgi:SAM-dependent methyltransferase